MVNYLKNDYEAIILKKFIKDIIIFGNEKRIFNSISNTDKISESSIVYCEDEKNFNISLYSPCSIIITKINILLDYFLNNFESVVKLDKDLKKDELFSIYNEYLKNNNSNIENINLRLNEILIKILNSLNKTIIIYQNPKILWAYSTSLFKSRTINRGIKGKNSVIKSNINISEIEIGENVVIEKGVKIGKNVYIGANSYIGENVEIGDNTYIYPNVTILENCIIGKNCIIHSGTVIGSDGFGYQFFNFNHIKIEQMGRVKIGNFVEIGSNCSIDRGTVNDTVISDMCKIDNLVQIAHNSFIDVGTVIASQSGIAGGAKIGKFVFMGGQVGVADHAIIEDGAKFAAQSGVSRKIYQKEKTYAGSPAIEANQFKRITASMKYLPEIVKKWDFNIDK